MIRITEKLSEEANRVAPPLPRGTNSDTLQPPHSLKVRVLTAPQLLALRIAAKPLQLAAWLLLTTYRNLTMPYPMVPSQTPYGHLLV